MENDAVILKRCCDCSRLFEETVGDTIAAYQLLAPEALLTGVRIICTCGPCASRYKRSTLPLVPPADR